MIGGEKGEKKKKKEKKHKHRGIPPEKRLVI